MASSEQACTAAGRILLQNVGDKYLNLRCPIPAPANRTSTEYAQVAALLWASP